MNPSARENARYQASDFCPARLEENLLLGYLQSIKSHALAPARLLDLGCGSGLITKQVQALGYLVKGLDFSSVAVTKAKQRGLDAAVANLDDGLPEPDSLYDVVLAGDIIEHLFDPIFVIKEAARVLKKGGHFLLTIPNDVSIMVRLKTLAGISYQESTYRRSGAYKHHTFFTRQLLKYMLSQAGMRVFKQERITNIGHRWQLHSTITPLIFTNELVVWARKQI